MAEDATLARLDERMANLEKRLDTAHGRIDGLEAIVREDLKAIRADLQPLRDWMNKGKGGLVALSAMSALVGALVTVAARKFLG